jgi:hypothetical protein
MGVKDRRYGVWAAMEAKRFSENRTSSRMFHEPLPGHLEISGDEGAFGAGAAVSNTPTIGVRLRSCEIHFHTDACENGQHVAPHVRMGDRRSPQNRVSPMGSTPLWARNMDRIEGTLRYVEQHVQKESRI